jgi:hypothetical protein
MPRRQTKKHGTRRRKMKGGYYSFEGATAPGAAAWGRGSEMGAFAVERGGNIGNMKSAIQYGRGRRRKSRGRKTKRKQRGGGKFGGVSAGYTGSGERGLANFVGSSTRAPTGDAALGAFNNHGANSLANSSSFNILPK